ncbi:RNase adapter RapZ [Schumannella sp. 10F1B-5-1]|uniref:RNase adapter RapZ n=1 Tax=Schumannella sp. 10F1B-5-1 TaxID=2590780 RepID=UPI001130A5A3|nr:RNase adapter RapZ [Schumannella sp. 10F1B-5-1]TPW70985.1 RNase adapter RapZ [Schumannella sp. 10F1B-5-1]
MTDSGHSTSSPDEREILIVTGMSGAGRSTVANALEDLGWYVVDNLPPQMLRPLADLSGHAADAVPKVAAVVDVRGGRLFSDVQQAIDELRSMAEVRVVFLDASDAALVRRFEQVRRPHPLQGEGTLLDGIHAERARMAELRSTSDVLIDTSDLNIHQLARETAERFTAENAVRLRLILLTFGFKYGLPADADNVADVRFLPNPFWVPGLREHTGLDPEVSDYVLGQEGALEFAERYVAALEPQLAGYLRENKRHATIAVGCTGGKHRSVAMAEEIARRLRTAPDVSVTVKHRDLGRE